MRAYVASTLGLLTASLLTWLGPSLHPAAAQSDDEGALARLLAEYDANPSLSTGCSLAEVERRLGRLDQAGARLDQLLTQARAGAPPDPATLSACRFNRARVHEDRGQARLAYPLLVQALDTPNAARRRVVEQRLVRVAAALVGADGCAALPSRYSAHALLRFGDDAALRACVQAVSRTQPFCTRMATADIPRAGEVSGYLLRRVDAQTEVIVDEGYLMVITRRGSRSSGLECRLPNHDEQIGTAGWLQLGRQRLLEVRTDTSVSYACDCDEGDDGGGDCRCSDDSTTRYYLSERGALVMALVDAFGDGGMAAWGRDAPELHDAAATPTVVEGSVAVINGRRLRLVRGALVPAP